MVGSLKFGDTLDNLADALEDLAGALSGAENTSWRPSWDVYWLGIAQAVSARGTCNRKRVGAVIVRDNHCLATGYNGALPGLPHCEDEGCDMEHTHCVRTNHAECNAIAQAARHGTRLDGATIYVTCSPCWSCFRMVASVGIRRVVYGEFYRDERIFAAASALGIELVQVGGSNGSA